MDLKKGFTLIELLVVVAIIGILAAVGVVAYNGFTSSSKENAAQANYAMVVKYMAIELAGNSPKYSHSRTGCFKRRIALE